jgi:hypothetical protein
MGRVRHFSKDQGEPGKFYFTEPELIEVKGRAAVQVETTKPSHNIVTPFPKGNEIVTGRCRLESSHGLHEYHPPTDCVYDLPEWPKPTQVPEYLRKMEVAGFGEGAIVTRRYQNQHRWKYPHQWGIIIITHKVIPSGSPYKPFTIRWFDPNSKLESAWAEDLLIIHACLSPSMLQDIVECQGLEVDGD